MKKAVLLGAAALLMVSLGCGPDPGKKGINSGKDIPVPATDTQK